MTKEIQIIKASCADSCSGSGGRVSPGIRKVAAYCRVSTDSEEQETSYEAQCTYYTKLINGKADWQFAGIFADEGISGTQAKIRPQFLQMISSCEAHQIDLIITKSISRFSRNTLDCLHYVRKLKDLGIPVIFEKEGIHTMEETGELLLTIMASISQQESKSISDNIRMGHHYNFLQGKGLLNTTRFLGYDRGSEPHTLVINPGQARIVQQIYREFLEGFSPAMICRRLSKRGIPTVTGKDSWHQSTILSILQNEKYCGDLIMQKTYTPDFLTHRSVKNTGQLPQYYISDNHEPIIPKAVFHQVQHELLRRKETKQDPAKIRYAGTNVFNRKLICENCGQKLRRYADKNDPAKSRWRCSYQADHSSGLVRLPECKRTVAEHRLYQAVITAFNRLKPYYSRLMEEQADIRKNDLDRLDQLLEASSKALSEMDEALSCCKSADDEQSAHIQKKKETLLAERKALYTERAVHAYQAVQNLILIELVELMLDKENHTTRKLQDIPIPDESSTAPSSCACYKEEDFYRQTRYVPRQGIVNDRGEIIYYEPDFVTRYLESITILNNGFEFLFKAGIRITI